MVGVEVAVEENDFHWRVGMIMRLSQTPCPRPTRVLDAIVKKSQPDARPGLRSQRQGVAEFVASTDAQETDAQETLDKSTHM